MTYSIQEVSEKTGLSAHTLRYYEKESLLPGVERSSSGFRQYSDADLELLGGICCLKNTGMSLREIARFMQLTKEGDSTLRQRCGLLEAHRGKVLARMAEAGVARYAVIGSDMATSRACVDYVKQHPEAVCAVGIHPHEAKTFREGDLEILAGWIRSGEAKAPFISL